MQKSSELDQPPGTMYLKSRQPLISKYSIETAIETLGFGKFQVRMAAIIGLTYMADYVEMMILSILPAALSCEWNIRPWEKATLTTVPFIGMLISGTAWGGFSDKYGRKAGLWLCTIVTFYFGLLSSFAPNFIWVLILRGLVGFGVGGVPQAFTLFSEFSPTVHRAKVFSLLSIFGPVGTCLETALAIIIMPTLGWRYLLFISSIPVLISCVTCAWLPESARFYLANGENNKAIKVLEEVSYINKVPLPEGELVAINNNVKRGGFKELFCKKQRRYSVILWVIWFTNAFSYYGIVLLTAEIFQYGNVCQVNSGQNQTKSTCNLRCMSDEDYKDFFLSSLSEFAAYVLTVVMVDRIGRLKTIFSTMFAFAIFTMSLNICFDRGMLVLLFTIARFFITITFQAIYVYTPEFYPTSVRALGLGTCGTVARIGAIITPFVAQVLYAASPNAAISLYAGTALITSFLCFLLPETRNKNLKDVNE